MLRPYRNHNENSLPLLPIFNTVHPNASKFTILRAQSLALLKCTPDSIFAISRDERKVISLYSEVELFINGTVMIYVPDPQIPTPGPDPLPSPNPEPSPEPAPVPEPVPGPIPQPVPGPVPEPVPAPIPQPAVPEPVPEIVPTPIPQTVPGTIPQTIPGPQ